MSVWTRLIAALRRRFGRDASATKRLGRLGEDAACRLLRDSGYAVVERNVRVPMGEADIIARDPDGVTMVVVEVKARRRTDRGVVSPEVNITAWKRRKLRAIARHLTRANGWDAARVRVDVVAVEVGEGEALTRHWVGIG